MKSKAVILRTVDTDVGSRQWFEKGDMLKASSNLSRRSTYRNALLLPYLSTQALIDDESMLLCLLQNRVLFSPAEWATSDLQLTYFGRRSGLLERIFNETYFYISDGVTAYGNPLAYDEDLFHDPGNLIGFPNAQILFEAQRKLYVLLREVVTDLLKSAEDMNQGNTQWIQDATLMFVKEPVFYPRDEMGTGEAVDRHVCSPPHTVVDLANRISLSAEIRGQAAERELLSLQTGTYAKLIIAVTRGC